MGYIFKYKDVNYIKNEIKLNKGLDAISVPSLNFEKEEKQPIGGSNKIYKADQTITIINNETIDFDTSVITSIERNYDIITEDSSIKNELIKIFIKEEKEEKFVLENYEPDNILPKVFIEINYGDGIEESYSRPITLFESNQNEYSKWDIISHKFQFKKEDFIEASPGRTITVKIYNYNSDCYTFKIPYTFEDIGNIKKEPSENNNIEFSEESRNLISDKQKSIKLRLKNAMLDNNGKISFMFDNVADPNKHKIILAEIKKA